MGFLIKRHSLCFNLCLLGARFYCSGAVLSLIVSRTLITTLGKISSYPGVTLKRTKSQPHNHHQQSPEIRFARGESLNFIDSPTNSAESVVVVFRKIQCQAHLHFHNIKYQSLCRTPSGSENTRESLHYYLYWNTITTPAVTND